MNDTLNPVVETDTHDPNLVDNLPDMDDDFDPANGDDSDTPSYQLEDFDDAPQEPVNPNNPDPNSQDNPDPNGGKNWEESAKYFQSEHDKLKNELNGYVQVKPLYDLVTSDPAVAERVTLAIMNQSQPQQPTPDAVTPEPELQPPTQPDDYDAFEARTNPDSASYKYEESLSEFRVQKAIQETLKPILGKVESVNQVLETQQKATAYQQQQVSWKSEFMKQGMSANVADNLVGFMSSDASLTPQGWTQFLSGTNQAPTGNQKPQGPPTSFDQAKTTSQRNSASGGGSHGNANPKPQSFDSSFAKEAGHLDY